MTEKKNYCVSGKCTNNEHNMNGCLHSFCDVIDCVYLEMDSKCTSPAANAESKDGEE